VAGHDIETDQREPEFPARDADRAGDVVFSHGEGRGVWCAAPERFAVE
jgi:hypothetical protein